MENEFRKRGFELMLGCLLLVGIYVLSKEGAKLVASAIEGNKIIVIDAGHGGDDPGKVGVDQVLEKDINLEIAKLVEQQLTEQGYHVVMTRTADVMQGSKSEDMKHRSVLINESRALCAVSIHQNSYSDPEIKGAQVFYFKESKEGQKMANILQRSLIDEVDPDNHRQAKENETYYLLKKTEIPIVIVECGFLSNYEEGKKLQNKEYQRKIADAICEGIIIYAENREAV